MKIFGFIFLFIPFIVSSSDYPLEWFAEIPRESAASWEILPQDAAPGEVILSKRTELGVFSNFSATPFEFEGKRFASIEGLWQSLKYPDPDISHDQRSAVITWPHRRSEVEQMISFEAKRAGEAANRIYKENNLKNISWGSHFFDYNDFSTGSDYHYNLMKNAMKAKLEQTPGLWELLLKTKCLKLLPDHKVNENNPASYHYYKIFMELRSLRQTLPCP
jgi:hypothetical protein